MLAHQRPSLEAISYLLIWGLCTFQEVSSCKNRKLLLEEYIQAIYTSIHSPSEILRGCNRVPAIDLLSYWLVYSSFSSSHHSKEKQETPSPLLISFYRPKIRRSLKEDFNRLTGNVGKNRGENEWEQKKSFSTETEKDIIQRRVSSKTHVQSPFFLE